MDRPIEKIAIPEGEIPHVEHEPGDSGHEKSLPDHKQERAGEKNDNVSTREVPDSVEVLSAAQPETFRTEFSEGVEEILEEGVMRDFAEMHSHDTVLLYRLEKEAIHIAAELERDRAENGNISEQLAMQLVGRWLANISPPDKKAPRHQKLAYIATMLAETKKKVAEILLLSQK